LNDEQLYGDLRLRRLACQLTTAVQRFQRTAAVPPGLDTALTGFLAQLRRHGRDAERRMRMDCHQRLLTHLAMSAEEERHKVPYTAARIKAAYQLAQQQIGDAVGTADPAWILCGFADLTAPAESKAAVLVITSQHQAPWPRRSCIPVGDAPSQPRWGSG